MKAALYDSTGSARDVLKVTEVERPEPGPGEVRVRVEVSGINPTDVKSRSGATPRPIDGFQIPDHDGAGVIDAVGAGVDPARIGQRVWLFTRRGRPEVGHRGRVDRGPGAPARCRCRTAPAWSWARAWACRPSPRTAACSRTGRWPGKTVLVTGGAGAVGHFAIELAKRAGARVVTTVSGPEKAELARAAGADLVLNYREQDVAGQVRSFAGGPVDRIIEVALAANLETDLALSGPQTVIVTYAATPPDPVLPVRACMTANVTLRFVLLYTRPGGGRGRGGRRTSPTRCAPET